jgi:uncharacterized RDD family membrane protein YckC
MNEWYAPPPGIRTAEGIRLGLASRWTRFLGQMIDGGIATGPLLIVGAVARFGGGIGPVLAILGGAWAAFYLLFGDGLHGGQSLAKQWLGMRVVDEKTGAPCTYGESFIRNISQSLLGPIDWIFIFGEKHQRLGDKLVGTIVVLAD